VADDIKIKYGSSGFEKVAKELAQLEKQAGGSASWFAPMKKTIKDAEDAGHSLTSSLSKGFSSAISMGGNLIETLAKVAGGITAVAGLAGGAATAAFISWSMSVLKTTESFKMLEISMYGATKSWDAVGTASKFAKEYAAEYPAMYSDVMKALQSFAYIPALKPMIQSGDVQNMKEMMHVVQGLLTMRPEQGVQGAIYALREALAGNWRSLMFRFDVPIASIAKSAGMTMEQMKQSPEQAIKALKSFIDEFVGADTMAMMAKNLSIQVGNLRDKYEMWLDKLGKTGVYEKVVGYLLKLNDALDAFMKSDRMQKWTEQINVLLEKVVDRIAKVFTEGIDWENIADLSGLMNALIKVGENAASALRDLWDAIKDPLVNGLKAVLKTMWEASKPIIKEVFFPMGKEIAKMIIDGIYSFMKEHPVMSALFLGFKGMQMGSAFGPKGMAIGFGAGVLGGIAPAVIEAVGNLFSGPSAEEEKKALKEMADTTGGVTEEQRKEIAGIKEVNKNLDDWNKALDNLIADLRGTKAGGIPGGGGEAELTEKQLEQQRKLVAFEEQGQWAQYQAWSRMGMMMAQAPETGGMTAWSRYLKGELNWEQMKRQEKVETFQASQLSELEKMALAQKEKEEPNYGMLARTYGEMFNISYQRGDFSKAQEYMNLSLQAMRDDIKAQTDAARKGLDAAIDTAKNTGKMEEHLRVIRDEQGREKAVMPAEREVPFEPYRGYNVATRSRTFSDQPMGDVVAREVAEDQVG
jgi:hypothetical protein